MDGLNAAIAILAFRLSTLAILFDLVPSLLPFAIMQGIYHGQQVTKPLILQEIWRDFWDDRAAILSRQRPKMYYPSQRLKLNR